MKTEETKLEPQQEQLDIPVVIGSPLFKEQLLNDFIPRIELMEEKERQYLHYLIDIEAPLEFIQKSQETQLHFVAKIKEYSWDEKLNSFVESLATQKDQIIMWGGNFYNLPPTDTWLIWDKLQDNRGSDAEMAWGKLKKRGCRVFRMSRIDAYFNKRIFPKEHPTEKPIQLMEFCVNKTTGVVIDPFMGVGSTGLACVNLNRSFIGIEKDENYYDIACRRISQHCH